MDRQEDIKADIEKLEVGDFISISVYLKILFTFIIKIVYIKIMVGL